jgi:DNA-binding CsgD family transcriptional regulator
MPELDRLAVSRREVPLLTRWGASPEADLVFRALVEVGDRSPDELTRCLGVAAGRVRSALDELAAAGVAHPTPDGSRWRALPPRDAVVALRRHRAAAAVGTRRQVAERLVTLAELGSGCAVPTAERLHIRPLVGLTQVRSRLAELVEAGRHEYLSMQPEQTFSRDAVRAAAPHNRALLARAMTVLTLGVPAADDVTEAHMVELTSGGMEYRELGALPTKLMIVDRRTAVVPLDPARTSAGALEITAPSTVRSLTDLFLAHWSRSDRPHVMPAASVELSARERAVVVALAGGCTDRGAAALLGLSARTVAYTVRALMDRYHAQNRFQLGLVLGAAGLRVPSSASKA